MVWMVEMPPKRLPRSILEVNMKKKKRVSLRSYIAKENKIKEDHTNKTVYEWYNLRPLLGNFNWAMMAVMLGAREAGKSYSVTDFFVTCFMKNHNPFYWIRLSDASCRKLLKNNAELLIDPDIRRRYNLDLITKGSRVYRVLKRGKKGKNGELGQVIEKELMATVLSAATYYNEKGAGYFDKDMLKNHPNWWYNIACDEFEREANEKNNFDVTYSLVNQLENLIRSTKEHVRIFFIGNTLEESSDLLASIDFIPEQYGVYKLKKKRIVVEYIQPTEAYLQRRKGTVADILMPQASTFTNKINTDTTLIDKRALVKPMYIIKFTKSQTDWFTMWSGQVITRWTGQTNLPIWAMRPYIDAVFTQEIQKNVIDMFDSRSMKFHDLITFKFFQKQLSLLKPRK